MRDYSICPIDINRPKGSRIKLGIHWSNRRDAIVSPTNNVVLFYVRSDMENVQKLWGRLIFNSASTLRGWAID